MSAKLWTPEEEALLRELYPHNLTEELVPIFGRGQRAIVSKAHKLGLHKTPEARTKCNSKGLFKKGMTPHNKGRKWDEWMSKEGQEVCKKTQIYPGHTLYKDYPMYHESKNSFGYITIKVPGERYFIPKHKWLWENAHGKVPKGCMIVYKDGNPMNCVLENLKVVSKSEIMRNKYPPELKYLFNLRAALTRQINKHSKKQNSETK